MMFGRVSSLLSLLAWRASGFGYAGEDAPMLLVGNTRGASVSAFDLTTGSYLGAAVTGVDDPDDLNVYDGDLYVSQGTTLETSAILKCGPVRLGATCEPFATGGGMLRPYGFSFYGDTLYVASFLSDAILSFDAATGEFVEVFAQGNATEEGLVNGPDDIAIDAETGKMYVTTQGSVAVDGAADFGFGLQSKIIVFDLETKMGATFVDDIAPIGPFISLLGVKIVDDALWVSDFAGGIRKYDLVTADLLATYATAFTEESHWVGNLDFMDEYLYAVAFVNDEAANFPGAVLKYDTSSGDSLDMVTEDQIFIGPTTDLVRPIGILVV